jgi:hypothetical protein
MICKACRTETSALANGRCWRCAQIAQDKWQERMAIRMDASQFEPQKLVNSLLTHHWMHECKIIPDYMPPFPGNDTRPTCVICYEYRNCEPDAHPTSKQTFLRYSKGPAQGYFWDNYGDDFHRPELALVALSQAAPPPRIDVVIDTHGR